MCANGYQYIWRCVRCSNHLCSIIKMDGLVKMEKKCPKCKAINVVTFVNEEISIKCKLYSGNKEDFVGNVREIGENFY